jgi:ATP-binding protein involved in chromosome partitioning
VPSTQDVYSALKSVPMPELGADKDVVSAAAVRNLVISGGAVSFDLVLAIGDGVPEERVQERQAACESAVKGLADVTSVHVKTSVRPVPVANQRSIMPHVKHVIAVASGKGGVGKSTTAANLAVALHRQGHRVGLLDADIYGPSVPTMFGVSGRPEPAGEKQIHPMHAHGISLMSIGFLVDPDTPMVWRGPMVHGALTQFMEQVVWGELDYVVVDMPPGTGDAQLTLTQKAPLSGAVIVTTPQEVSLVDARKGLKMFEQVKVPVLGIIENMSYFVCNSCDAEHDIFLRGGGRRAAEEMSVPFLGEIPLQSGIAASGDGGLPIVLSAPESAASKAFLELASTLHKRLGHAGAEPSGLQSMAWKD